MGIKQWIFQRISNIAIVSFGLWMFWLIVSPGEIDAVTIYEILNSTSNKIFFSIILVLASLNSILACWQIAGDYANKFGVNQNLIVIIVGLISLSYLIFGTYLLFLK